MTIAADLSDRLLALATGVSGLGSWMFGIAYLFAILVPLVYYTVGTIVDGHNIRDIWHERGHDKHRDTDYCPAGCHFGPPFGGI